MNYQKTAVVKNAILLCLMLYVVQNSLAQDSQKKGAEVSAGRITKMHIDMPQDLENGLNKLLQISYKQRMGNAVAHLAKLLKELSSSIGMVDTPVVRLAFKEAISALQANKELLSSKFYGRLKQQLIEFGEQIAIDRYILAPLLLPLEPVKPIVKPVIVQPSVPTIVNVVPVEPSTPVEPVVQEVPEITEIQSAQTDGMAYHPAVLKDETGDQLAEIEEIFDEIVEMVGNGVDQDVVAVIESVFELEEAEVVGGWSSCHISGDCAVDLPESVVMQEHLEPVVEEDDSRVSKPTVDQAPQIINDKIVCLDPVDSSGVEFIPDRSSVINVRPCQLGLNFIRDLRPVSYQHKDQSVVTKKTYGMISQDISRVIANHHAADFCGFDIDTCRLNYNNFIAPIIKAIQELAAQNQDMRKHIDLLERKTRRHN